jgi:hypothetical protein
VETLAAQPLYLRQEVYPPRSALLGH